MGPGARRTGPLGFDVLPTNPYGIAFWTATLIVADGSPGPSGLETSDQAAEGSPPLDPPPGTLSHKLVADHFDGQVRVLLCRAADPAVSHMKLARIRALAKAEKVPSPEKALAFTRLAVATSEVRARTVAGRTWFTAVTTLRATQIVLPSELWAESEILAVTGHEPTRQVEDFHKAHDELLVHEQGHGREAFEYLSDVSLGYDAAYSGSATELPTLQEFRSRIASADETAARADGPLQASAAFWDEKDSFLTARLAGYGIRIDDGMNPGLPHYDPR